MDELDGITASRGLETTVAKLKSGQDVVQQELDEAINCADINSVLFYCFHAGRGRARIQASPAFREKLLVDGCNSDEIFWPMYVVLYIREPYGMEVAKKAARAHVESNPTSAFAHISTRQFYPSASFYISDFLRDEADYPAIIERAARAFVNIVAENSSHDDFVLDNFFSAADLFINNPYAEGLLLRAVAHMIKGDVFWGILGKICLQPYAKKVLLAVAKKFPEEIFKEAGALRFMPYYEEVLKEAGYAAVRSEEGFYFGNFAHLFRGKSYARELFIEAIKKETGINPGGARYHVEDLRRGLQLDFSDPLYLELMEIVVLQGPTVASVSSNMFPPAIVIPQAPLELEPMFPAKEAKKEDDSPGGVLNRIRGWFARRK